MTNDKEGPRENRANQPSNEARTRRGPRGKMITETEHREWTKKLSEARIKNNAAPFAGKTHNQEAKDQMSDTQRQVQRERYGTDARDEKIAQALHDGVKVDRIARELGVHPATVRASLKKQELDSQAREREIRGQRNEEIWKDRLNGATKKQLMDKYSLSMSAINKILTKD